MGMCSKFLLISLNLHHTNDYRCDVSYGGLCHFAKLEESMCMYSPVCSPAILTSLVVVIAYEIYAELSLNLHHIKEVCP